jgi:hypothetical protein
MRRVVPAVGAAAAAAFIFASGFTGCTTNSTSTIQGPFKAHCSIPQKGIAYVSFRNTGGRSQPLGSFVIDLINSKGRVTHQKPVKLKTPATIGPGQAAIYRYGIAYSAYNCGAVKPRRH